MIGDFGVRLQAYLRTNWIPLELRRHPPRRVASGCGPPGTSQGSRMGRRQGSRTGTLSSSGLREALDHPLTFEAGRSDYLRHHRGSFWNFLPSGTVPGRKAYPDGLPGRKARVLIEFPIVERWL